MTRKVLAPARERKAVVLDIVRGNPGIIMYQLAKKTGLNAQVLNHLTASMPEIYEDDRGRLYSF